MTRHLSHWAALLLVAFSFQGAAGRTEIDVVEPFGIGPGPGWKACYESLSSGDFEKSAEVPAEPTRAPGPGWWKPSSLQKYVADAQGVEFLLVPSMSTPWRCGGDLCWDDLKGHRGDALLVVPKGWDASTSKAPRTVYLHGGQWLVYSPFSTSYVGLGSDVANRTGGPVLVVDYPLVAVGSWRDQVSAALQGLRWLAAWDGSVSAAAGVCRPGKCEGVAPAGGGAAADSAPTLQQLLDRKTSGSAAVPPMVFGADSAGGHVMLATLAALASGSARFGAPAGSAALVSSAFGLAPAVDFILDLSPTLVTGRFCENPAKGIILGDFDFGKGSASEYWWGEVTTRQGLLRGSGNMSAAEELQDFEVVSPLWAAPEVLRQFPPLNFQVGGNDVLWGETVEFGQRVAEAGGRAVQVDVYDGMWHVFQGYGAGCGGGPIPAAGVSLERIQDFVRGFAGLGPLPIPQDLGFAVVRHYLRWPEREAREKAKEIMYDW